AEERVKKCAVLPPSTQSTPRILGVSSPRVSAVSAVNGSSRALSPALRSLREELVLLQCEAVRAPAWRAHWRCKSRLRRLAPRLPRARRRPDRRAAARWSQSV